MPTKINDTLEIYDLDELSKILGLHIVTLQRYCRTKKIKSQRVGRNYKVTSESLRAFLNGETNKEEVKEA